MLPEIVETVNVRDHLDVLTCFFKVMLAFPHAKLHRLFVFKIILTYFESLFNMYFYMSKKRSF